MNKQNVFEHFSRVIDNMIDNSLFFPTYFQYPTMLDNNILGNDSDDAVPNNISIRFGVSRGCIVDDDYDYVVKFDLDPDCAVSCCNREVEIYKAAKNEGLEQYFIEPTYLGTYTRTIQFYDAEDIGRHFNWYDYDESFDDDFAKEEDNFGTIHPVTICVPLYAYAKVSFTMSPPIEQDVYEKYASMVSNYSDSPLKERAEVVAVRFMKDYGEEKFVQLSDFLEAEDVNDIHRGNIGLINNHWVILDYAGWHDSCY